MRAKLTKKQLEEIEKYVVKKDKESLAKIKASLLFGDWEIERPIKAEPAEPATVKYEPHPTIAADASSATATATHTRTIKVSPATIMVDSAISTTEDVLEEFQSIYDSWGIARSLSSSLLTTKTFEQLPSLIIKDTLETLIATDIKDKIKYYVNETPVLDIASIYPYHHFFKVAIDGYREKIRKFHLSTDRIQSLYQQTTRAPKKHVEKMFNYIFIDIAEDLAEFQYKSDQFYFAICNQIPYFISEYKKPHVLKTEAWEGIREDARRYVMREEDTSSDIASSDYSALDEDGKSDWRRVHDSEWEI